MNIFKILLSGVKVYVLQVDMSHKLTVGVLIQDCGALRLSSSLVRARIASAMAALVTCFQPSDKLPLAMSWTKDITLLAKLLDILPRNHQRGPVALYNDKTLQK